MRPVLALILLFLWSAAVRAQAPPSNLPMQNPSAPQGPVPINEEPHNCPETQPAVESKKGKKRAPEVAADEDVPYFESDEVRVDLHKVSAGNDYVDAEAKFDVLLVGLTNSNLDANLSGEHFQFLHGGDVIWMPAGQQRHIVDFLGTHSGFLLITFKDGTKLSSTQ